MAKKQDGEKKGKVGQGPFTAKKQRMFACIVASHTRCLAKQSSDPYYHFDIYAGPGKARYGNGSPLIFFKYRKPGLIYKSYFVEQNHKNAFSLHYHLKETGDSHYEIYHGPCEEFLQLMVAGLRYPIRGLLYADPNGMLPFHELNMLTELDHFINIDLLLKVDSKSYKRGDLPRGVIDRAYHMKKLKAAVGFMGKKHWFITEPIGEADNMLLLATNSDYKPPRYFVPLRSNRGTFWVSKILMFRDHITRGVVGGLSD